ncbi:MAG: hypothetical protein P1U58_06170 [Verrucomicrobiales bacterium]|nr:hypothetical protein [Verrucomicrobiales bacterium]
MKMITQTILCILALSFGAEKLSAEELIVYPNADAPIFTIEVPKNWTLTPAPTPTQFFLVAGPAGVKMWFRAAAVASEKEVEAAIEAATASGKEWFTESYENIALGDLVMGERKGIPFSSISGAGVAKADGEEVVFAVTFGYLPNGSLAEFWAVIPANNRQALKTADKVISSFEPK